jgi:hypothetical protein
LRPAADLRYQIAVVGRRSLYPRYLAPCLRAALADTPAVLIHGPRQSGKTTLARAVGEPRGYRYISFDDPAVLAAVQGDPIGFVSRLPARTILDEVQRAAAIFPALKTVIDARRTPGRFILTGSANILLVPRPAESLAGRLGILRLHPLAQGELARRRPRFLDALFRGRFKSAGVVERLGRALTERIVAGGYPAALVRNSPSRRRAWYRDYSEALVERDVRDLSRIRSFEVLPRLLTLIAGRTASLINVADLAAPFELTRQTIHEYVTLLERVFLIERLPVWHTNRLTRAVKRPKLHMGDTGVACALLGFDATALDRERQAIGPLLETFVLQELRRQACALPDRIEFLHYRDRDDFEVDIVLEQGRMVAGVETKAAASVAESDLRGLRKLRDAAGSHFAAGVVLYDGPTTISFGGNLYAVPIRMLWETGGSLSDVTTGAR